jgi:hypothetical protein
MFENYKHPSVRYQSLTHSERLLAKAFDKAANLQYESALAYFTRVYEVKPNPCDTAVAKIGIEACNAALSVPFEPSRDMTIWEGETEYKRVLQEGWISLPPECSGC